MPAIKLQGRVVRSWVKITVPVPGFFLGGVAFVSCSTSTPINHIVFYFSFCRIPVVLENHRSSQGGGGGRGVRSPCTLHLDPPLDNPGLVQDLNSDLDA